MHQNNNIANIYILISTYIFNTVDTPNTPAHTDKESGI